MTLVNMTQGSKVKEELEKQQKIVPKRNHISINSVSFTFFIIHLVLEPGCRVTKSS